MAQFQSEGKIRPFRVPIIFAAASYILLTETVRKRKHPKVLVLSGLQSKQAKSLVPAKKGYMHSEVETRQATTFPTMCP